MTVNKQFVKRAALSLALGLGLAGSFYAGIAYAADARLDSANSLIIKADALLKAASNPNLKHHPFGGHRTRAVRLLKEAEKQIAEAKKYADSPHHQGKHKAKAKGKTKAKTHHSKSTKSEGKDKDKDKR